MKEKQKSTKKSIAKKSRYTLRPSDWTIALLAILVIYAWASVFANPIDFRMGLFDVWYHNIIFHPSVAMLMIAIFGSLYIYRDIRRKDVGRYSRWIAYLFAVLVTYYLIVQLNVALSSGASPTCTGFMGGKTTCAEAGQIYAYIYLLNPFSLLVGGVLSAVGSVVLLVKTKRELATGQKKRSSSK